MKWILFGIQYKAFTLFYSYFQFESVVHVFLRFFSSRFFSFNVTDYLVWRSYVNVVMSNKLPVMNLPVKLGHCAFRRICLYGFRKVIYIKNQFGVVIINKNNNRDTHFKFHHIFLYIIFFNYHAFCFTHLFVQFANISSYISRYLSKSMLSSISSPL